MNTPDTWFIVFGSIITLAGLGGAAYGYVLLWREYRDHSDELDKWL